MRRLAGPISEAMPEPWMATAQDGSKDAGTEIQKLTWPIPQVEHSSCLGLGRWRLWNSMIAAED